MQQAQVKGVWELMCWGLAVLLRRINGLKPDLPSSVAQCQAQPNWPGECRPVAGAIPWRLTQTVAHVASLTLFASLYMANSLQTGSNPGSRGEDRIPARHTHLASHVLTFAKCSIVMTQFWSPQTQFWYKQRFWSVRRRTPGPAKPQVFGTMKRIVAASSVCSAPLCCWCLVLREQPSCSHRNAKKERKAI